MSVALNLMIVLLCTVYLLEIRQPSAATRVIVNDTLH
jgi:hypothetical protein